MDFREWKKRYNEAVGGKYVLKYRPYVLLDNTYNLGEEISRENFEQHRRDTDRFYDMKNNVTIRPLVSNPNEGFFEYSVSIKEEKTWEVEEAALEAFITEYAIVDTPTLLDFLDYNDSSSSRIEQLKALSQLPNLLKKFQ